MVNKVLKMKWIVFSILISCYVYTPAHGQPKQVYAVLVGVSIYNDHRNNLQYADADARRMYSQLITMGVPAENITILTNGRATKEEIMAATDKQFNKARTQDEVIFFFSGHGGNGFLVTTDIPHYLYYTNLKTFFKNCKAHRKILFADACYSGGLKDDAKIGKYQPAEESIKNFSDSVKQVVVFSASRYDQKSIENSLYHGYFTYFIIRALKGNADTDNNGSVTFKEFFEYVNSNVKYISKNKQVPVMFGKFDPESNFYNVFKKQ